jgi:hypothetical protein|nr:MAG TPA: hypothetical protein [Caudoviricetes sp.]
MRINPYYNNETMNLKKLAKDLEKQGYICKLSEDGEYMSVYYLCYLDYVEIALTGFKDWYVAYYQPFKGLEIYKLVSNQATQKAFGRCK